MSWCPKCKNEYRAGITICPDCNEELMEELTEAIELEFVPVFQTIEEETKEKIVKYLVHCGHKVKEETGTVETEEGIVPAFQVFVPKADVTEVVKEIRTVLAYDANKEEEERPKNRRREPHVSNLYVDAKERCREYKSTGIMFLVFAVVSAVLLWTLRPIIKKHFTPKLTRTNIDAVIGSTGMVTVNINNTLAQGTIVINGMEWSARSASGEIISANTPVRVERVEGVRVFVTPVEVTAVK